MPKFFDPSNPQRPPVSVDTDAAMLVRLPDGLAPAPAPAPQPAPAAPSIQIEPDAEGTIDGAAPADFTWTIRAAGLDRVKAAVFQVQGSKWTVFGNGPLQEIALGPDGAATFTGTLRGDGDRLVVKSADEKVECVTKGATFAKKPAPQPAPVPAAAGLALDRARKYVAPLRIGLNVERGEALWNGWIDDAALRSYAAAGCTHVRYFPPSGGQNPVMGAEKIYLWIDAAKRTLAAGMSAHLDLCDWMGIEHFSDAVANYVQGCAGRIAAAGLDPARFVVGAVNEYAGGDHAQFEGWRERLSGILHDALPNHVVVVNGAYWGDPDTLVKGGFKVDPSKPRIVQWHKYETDAANPGNAPWWQGRLDQWARDNQAVTLCGEWGVGPPDNSNGAATDYGAFPTHIRNVGNGMGQQRPTIWTVTNGGWWRLNENGSARLRPEVAAALKDASDAVAKQGWYKAAA